MTKKKYITGNIRRSIIAAMAALTLISSVAGTAVSTFADTMDTDPAIMNEMEGQDDVIEVDGAMPDWAKESTSAIIKTGIGAIPVVGDFADVLDPMIKELFGLNPADDTAEKLQEISDRLESLELKLDEKATQEMLAMYKTDKMNQFNHDITAVRNMTANYLEQISDYMQNPNTTEAQKDIMIGTILDTNTSSTTDYLTVVDTLTSFLRGDAVDSDPVSICTASYYANCADSVLGGEAAMKNAAYINNVISILDQAYKLEALVLDSKVVLAENWTGTDENGNPLMTDEEKAYITSHYRTTSQQNLLAECEIPDTVYQWRKSSGIVDKNSGQYTGVKRKYQLLLDTENPNSTVSKYNKMVEDNWCSFIRSAEYPGLHAKIDMVPIKMTVGKYLNNRGLSIKNDATSYEDYSYENYKNMVNAARDQINANVQNSGLTPAEIQKMLKHVIQEPIFSDLRTKATYQDLFFLDDYGFDMIKAASYDKLELLRPYFPDKSFAYIMLIPDRVAAEIYAHAAFVTGASSYNSHSIGYHGYGAEDDNRLTINYLDTMGNAHSFNPVDIESLPTGGGVQNHSDKTYHRYIWFEQAEPEVTLDCSNEVSNDAEIDQINAELAEALRINAVAGNFEAEDVNTEDVNTEDVNTDDVNTEALVITAEDGQLTGENEGTAWTVAEDGTLILNEGYKFRFEGIVEGRNIINYGEIVDGEFTNVNLTVSGQGIITKAIFNDSQIAYEDASAIKEEVLLNNTELVELMANAETAEEVVENNMMEAEF